MIRNPDQAILKWMLKPRAAGEAPPPLVAMAMRERDREEQIERNAQFAEPYLKPDGTRGNVADLIPDLYDAHKQLELQLGSMSRRALVRLELAHALQSKVLPLTDDGWIHSLPDRLRAARQSFCLGFRPADGRRRIMWDQKAGLSRICPDDAREDSARMSRRVIDPILALKKNGCQVTYAVFTVPNYQPGQLRKGIKAIYKRFGALLKRQKGGRLEFHNVDAAMCVLEAPLARDRTWNVHLNVILVHRGFLDWRAMQEAWHWGVHFQRIRGGKAELEAAMREIIKYSARAVAEKSQCPNTSTDGGTTAASANAPGQAVADTSGQTALSLTGSVDPSRSPPKPCAPLELGGPNEPARITSSGNGPPAMCDWTGQELLEWLTAFRGFRRTRTYRALYRLAKPARDDLTGYVWVGKGNWVATGFRVWLGPLFSIPGDKSTTPDALERYYKHLRPDRRPPKPPDRCDRFA